VRRATAAATRNPTWNGASAAPTACAGVAAAAAPTTADRSATPTALPSCLPALNSGVALAMPARGIVAIEIACDGMNTDATPSPSPSRSSRTSHRLVPAPTRARSASVTATTTDPVAVSQRAPIRGSSTRVTSWPPTMTPIAAPTLVSPDSSAESPSPFCRNSVMRYSAPM
jgi:hypothetical protein